MDAMWYFVILLIVLDLMPISTACLSIAPMWGMSYLEVNCSKNRSECICFSICYRKTRTASGSNIWTNSMKICACNSRMSKRVPMMQWKIVESPKTWSRPSNKTSPTLSNNSMTVSSMKRMFCSGSPRKPMRKISSFTQKLSSMAKTFTGFSKRPKFSKWFVIHFWPNLNNATVS